MIGGTVVVVVDTGGVVVTVGVPVVTDDGGNVSVTKSVGVIIGVDETVTVPAFTEPGIGACGSTLKSGIKSSISSSGASSGNPVLVTVTEGWPDVVVSTGTT
jgi:hypothetical protein